MAGLFCVEMWVNSDILALSWRNRVGAKGVRGGGGGGKGRKRKIKKVSNRIFCFLSVAQVTSGQM